MKAPHVSGDQIASPSRTSKTVQMCVWLILSCWKSSVRVKNHSNKRVHLNKQQNSELVVKVTVQIRFLPLGNDVDLDSTVEDTQLRLPPQTHSLSLPSSKILALHYFFPL